MDSPVNKKRLRVDSDELPESSEFSESSESKRIRVDLLESLEDSDELNSASQDLDSFIKSFEEEITNSNPPENTSGDRSSESGESRPEIEFLLEASDDELGLPPTESTVVKESVGLSQLNWYDDSFEYGFEYGELGVSDGNNEGEYEVLDGLFDYTDLGLPAQ